MKKEQKTTKKINVKEKLNEIGKTLDSLFLIMNIPKTMTCNGFENRISKLERKVGVNK